MNSKYKGDIAVGQALNYFLTNGYEVFLPIGDKRDFDLIIEKENKLGRVQIKYAGIWAGRDRCIVSLRVMGGNRSYHTAKKYKPDSFDHLFVYTAKGENYFFPVAKLGLPRSTLSVETSKYSMYRV